MTLIQRQTVITRALIKIHSRQWQNPGRRSWAVRKVGEFNTKRMVFAGYTVDEAKASFRDCMDMVRLHLAAA